MIINTTADAYYADSDFFLAQKIFYDWANSTKSILEIANQYATDNGIKIDVETDYGSFRTTFHLTEQQFIMLQLKYAGLMSYD